MTCMIQTNNQNDLPKLLPTQRPTWSLGQTEAASGIANLAVKRTVVLYSGDVGKYG